MKGLDILKLFKVSILLCFVLITTVIMSSCGNTKVKEMTKIQYSIEEFKEKWNIVALTDQKIREFKVSIGSGNADLYSYDFGNNVGVDVTVGKTDKTVGSVMIIDKSPKVESEAIRILLSRDLVQIYNPIMSYDEVTALLLKINNSPQTVGNKYYSLKRDSNGVVFAALY
jgi:hypothetical protein